MIDNLSIILPLLKWKDPNDDMYVLHLLQRKKEHHGLGAKGRIVKSYYINNEDYLLTRYDEIKRLCEFFQARAMINLNCRSVKATAFKSLSHTAEYLGLEDYIPVRRAYDKATSSSPAKYEKLWIIDVDGTADLNSPLVRTMVAQIETSTSGCENIIAGFVPSKTGLHIITRPFDNRHFRQVYPRVDIHRDNPTNLFIPDVQEDTSTLQHALEESLKLQAIYARLLNQYDDGKRIVFTSAQTWLDRLRQIRENQPD
jgi:hypothetical protein